jgi:hypothetical protein
VTARGHSRRAGAASEKARINLTKAIQGAITRIAAADPVLGEHLATTIRTGTFFSYNPSRRCAS